MNWLLIGMRLAKAVIVGANAIEGSDTTKKGDAKRELALKFANDALSICSDGLVSTPEVRKALEDYNDAYVRLQNAIATTKDS